MRKILTFVFAVGMFFGVAAQNSIYDFSVKNQDGEKIQMADYKGNVLLIVNTATECGFTPQYEGLQEMFNKYAGDGFMILDFPCNQFGGQAPGSNEEIHTFCTGRYGITFPQFDKVDVNGDNASPLFVWLKKQKGFAGFDLDNPIGKRLHEAFSKQDPKYAENPDIKWNFTKFLVDREGNVVKRYEPTTDIEVIMEDVYELMYK